MVIVIVMSQRLQVCFIEDENSIIVQIKLQRNRWVNIVFWTFHFLTFESERRKHTTFTLYVIFSPLSENYNIPFRVSRDLRMCKLLPGLLDTFRSSIEVIIAKHSEIFFKLMCFRSNCQKITFFLRCKLDILDCFPFNIFLEYFERYNKNNSKPSQ